MAVVETPCIKVCVIESRSGLCRGCGRTMGEIERWLSLSAEDRAEIMAELPARLAELERRRASLFGET